MNHLLQDWEYRQKREAQERQTTFWLNGWLSYFDAQHAKRK